jgi:hypothetical protein
LISIEWPRLPVPRVGENENGGRSAMTNARKGLIVAFVPLGMDRFLLNRLEKR